jgi:hypothetical protein
MNKADLMTREKNKYGKWASTTIDKPLNPIMYQPIENQRDVETLRNTMARGNYPLSMSDCEVVGINGDCGPTCPVFLREECPADPEEFEEKHGSDKE